MHSTGLIGAISECMRTLGAGSLGRGVSRVDHRAHVASIRPEYDTMVCGSVIHKYVALVVGLGPEAGSPGRTTRDQPPSRPPMALSGAPGAAPSTRWPVGPSAEHLERLQVLIEPSLTVSAKPHFLDLLTLAPQV